MRRARLHPFSLPLVAAIATCSPSAHAQCNFALAPGDAVAGADGPIHALAPWDPDGPGPAPMLLAVGGNFRTAGGAACSNIAAYEPVSRQWAAVGQGLGTVRAITSRPNGNLLAYSEPVGVFEWNGVSWQQLGPAMLNVYALAVLPNGDVVIGGGFQSIGAAPIHGIARWDGTSWQAMGAPTVPWALGAVDSFCRLPNGDLVAVGFFTQIGGVACSQIARWDGVAWSPFGGGSSTVPVSAVVTATGQVVAGGTFATPTGPASIARWNGTAWIDISAGLPIAFALLSPLPNGDVLALGPAGCWSWNGSGWSPYAPWLAGMHRIFAFAADDVFVGGTFAASSAVPSANCARWDGTGWRAPNDGNTGTVRTVAALPDGSWFVGGTFHSVGGQPANRLARFDGTTWTPIASTASNAVRHSIARPDGEVVVVGEFANAQGGMDLVMSWHGGQVVPIQQGQWGARVVNSLALASDGDVLMGYVDLANAMSGIARWNGTTLTFTPIPGGAFNALCELPNGDVLLAGFFPGSANPLVRWDGAQLTPFGTALNGTVTSLGLAPNGDVVAAGAFGPPAHVARWDGSAWQPYGTGLSDSVTSMAVLPDGDVIACERFSSGNTLRSRVQLWNGVAWNLLGDTVGQAMVVRSTTGEAALFGEFTRVGSAANAYFARLQPTCPAGVLDRGGGCAGAAGPVALAVTERAWIGGILRTRASGLPSGALSIGVFGFAAQSVPLSLLHPLGLPGCNLLTTDDIMLSFSVVAGACAPSLPVPNAASLVGAAFQHQLLGVEVSAAGHAAAVTSSNALQLTIGAL